MFSHCRCYFIFLVTFAAAANTSTISFKAIRLAAAAKLGLEDLPKGPARNLAKQLVMDYLLQPEQQQQQQGAETAAAAAAAAAAVPVATEQQQQQPAECEEEFEEEEDFKSVDELPEFKRKVLEVMRQPVEERKVTISRAKTAIDFPASFMLLASMNPCPCGYFNHPEKDCTCAPGQVQRYLNKVSGPLLDRIDLHVEVTPVKFNDLVSAQEAEKSTYIRDRVIAARAIQAGRFKDYKGIYCNAQMYSSLLAAVCVISESCRQQLARAMQQLKLSARAYDRILKVSRTIADLEGSNSVASAHMAEAIQFRSLDREGWGN